MINKQAISKRIIGLITAMLMMSIAVPAQEPSITWTGGGTESDPYQVSTAEELAAFRDAVNSGVDYAGKMVTLTADITVTGWTTGIGILTNNQNDNKPFLGIFDGQGHTITLTGSASLFAIIGKNSSTGGTVQNLGVKATITANTSHAGGIVGQSLGTVRNCYTEGAITNESGYAGGIVAHNGGQGTIQNCYSTASCTTVTAAGGIVGYNSGTVQQCYATGAIAGGAGGKAGGIAGSFSGSDIVLKNCIALNTGGITAATKKRVAASALLYYTDNFASPAIPGEWTDKGADKADGADLTDDNFTNVTGAAGAFAGWPTDGANDWDFGDNAHLPILKGFTGAQPVKDITRASVMSEPPITSIATADDLEKFRDAVAEGTTYEDQTVTLANDITVTDWTKGIGTDLKPFHGTFDGQGYVITLTGTTSLFKLLGNSGKKVGSIKNLGVNVTIRTGYNAGGIVENNHGTIEQCYTAGTITSKGCYNYAGGIAVQNSNVIRNCYSTVAITAQNGGGGIAQNNKGTIEQCYATGAISAKGEERGGIAGINRNGATIQNCIALNTSITGDGSSGRIVGDNSGTLAGNYASPIIPGEWSDKEGGKKDGTDLTEDNFITNATGDNSTFKDWSADSWDFGDNTHLPTLKDITGQGTMPTRTSFLNVEISSPVTYQATLHKGLPIRVMKGGTFTVATDESDKDDIYFNKLIIEEGGQVVTNNEFGCKELLAARTLGNKWTAYGSPVNMNAVAKASQKFYKLSGYKDTGNQSWSSSGSGTGTSYTISTLFLIATETNDVPVTLTAPATGSNPVIIPADTDAPTGEALYTGIFLFCANPTLKDVTIPVAYILNADGTRFERTENAVVKPFQSYIVANATTSAAVMSLRAGSIPTANEPVALPDNTFRVWAADGQLHLDASKPADISIYNTAGQLVRRLALTGQQTVSLPRGIYFVHSNNITYKVSL